MTPRQTADTPDNARTPDSSTLSDALASGSISLRLYPHDLPPREIVDELRAQAACAEAAGFDGVMTSEHHGGFPGYLPNPIQAAGWALEATERAWAAPAPLLLPLRHWSHAAEDLAWMASRFPGRVGAGVACGGLPLDFELAELPWEEHLDRFKAALPEFVAALRGQASGALADDRAIKRTGGSPLPLVTAAQSPGAVRRAVGLGVGVLYDSLQTTARTRALSDAYRAAGGPGPCIAIRRVWIGNPPRESVDAQMSFYRGYAEQQTQRHWGEGQELIHGRDGSALAERLAAFAIEGGCDALNLRVHLTGLSAGLVRDQISRIGEEALPALRAKLAAHTFTPKPPPSTVSAR